MIKHLPEGTQQVAKIPEYLKDYVVKNLNLNTTIDIYCSIKYMPNNYIEVLPQMNVK